MAVKPFDKKDYTQSDVVNQAQQALDDHKGKKPGEYSSQWKDSMDEIMGQIQNRDPFQYDPGKDPMYLQSMNRYQEMGRQAMMDTMGQASAMTGGYGNSYAQNAGQQSYQRYLQSLSDQLPRFQQMALDRYRAIGDDLYRKYGMMSDREKEDYSRYQVELSHYNSELDRLQGIYDREQDRDYNRFTDQQAFDYQRYLDDLNRQQQAARDQLEQERLEAAQAYQAERDKIKDAQWQAEFDEDRRRYENAMAASTSRGRSGGGGGGGGSRQPAPSPMSVEEVYWKSKEMGASTRELDAMLKQEIAKGNISSYDASELRNSHGPGTDKPNGGRQTHKNRTNKSIGGHGHKNITYSQR